MLIIALFLLILPYTALSDDGIALGLGKASGQRYSAILGDYNTFDQQRRDQSGWVWRYGVGYSRLQIGNNLGLNMSANTGVAIGGVPQDKDTGVGPVLGLEPINGHIQYNTSPYVQDFYQGFLGPSAGLQASLDKCRFLALGKGGGSAGTLGKNGIVPNAELAWGYSGFMSCGDLAAGFSRLFVGKKTMEHTTVMLNFTDHTGIGADYQVTTGIKTEHDAIGFFRLRY